MSKDFAEIAHDVVAGVGLLQRGAPDTMKAFGSLFNSGNGRQSHRYENERTDGTRDRHRGPLRQLRCLPHQNGSSAWR